MNPVANYILNKPKKDQEIFTFFHTLFTETYGLKSYLKWGIPTYFGNKHLFYLNPDKKAGIHLCFMLGNKLSNKHNILEQQGRKRVSSYLLTNIENFPYKILIESIEEAIALDKNITKK